MKRYLFFLLGLLCCLLFCFFLLCHSRTSLKKTILTFGLVPRVLLLCAFRVVQLCRSTKKVRIAKKIALQVRAVPQLTSPADFFLKKKLAPIHVTRYHLYWQILSFRKGSNDELDSKKSHGVGIDWDRLPSGQYLDGGELDQ